MLINIILNLLITITAPAHHYEALGFSLAAPQGWQPEFGLNSAKFVAADSSASMEILLMPAQEGFWDKTAQVWEHYQTELNDADYELRDINISLDEKGLFKAEFVSIKNGKKAHNLVRIIGGTKKTALIIAAIKPSAPSTLRAEIEGSLDTFALDE